MDTNPHATAKRNRKTLLIALSVFLIPFLAALMLHKTGLYKSVGTNNRGELITPPVAFEQITLFDAQSRQLEPAAFRKKWWIIYVMPEQCDQSCENSLYQMRQIHTALGPEQNRVATMLISAHELQPEYQSLIKQEFPELTVAFTKESTLENWFSETENQTLKSSQVGHIYLVDTMGAVFMYYPTYSDEQESILKGRDMLKDLKKVLKLSKIG